MNYLNYVKEVNDWLDQPIADDEEKFIKECYLNNSRREFPPRKAAGQLLDMRHQKAKEAEGV